MFSFLDHPVVLALCSILKLCVAILVICGLVHDHLGRRAVMKERERQRRLEELGIEEVDEYEYEWNAGYDGEQESKTQTHPCG